MTATTPEEAQVSLDRFLAGPATPDPPDPGSTPEAELSAAVRADIHSPTGIRVRATVGELADAEPLLALPALAFPATIEVDPDRRRERDGGVPRQPLLDAARPQRQRTDAAAPAQQRHRRDPLARRHLLVAHRLAPAGAGAIVRTAAHRDALETAVLSAFTTARPCDRKANRPPGAAALAEAARLLGPEGTRRRRRPRRATPQLIEGTG